jgi:hypothetical protein
MQPLKVCLQAAFADVRLACASFMQARRSDGVGLAAHAAFAVANALPAAVIQPALVLLHAALQGLAADAGVRVASRTSEERAQRVVMLTTSPEQ